MPEDVKQSGQASGSENNEENDDSQKADSGSDISVGRKSDEKPPKDVPYSRFKEVNEKAKENQQIVDWYRENIGDPNDVVAFKAWKQEQLERAKEDEKKGKISPEKLAQFREAMRLADPEYREFLEERKREREERMEGQFDDAADKVRDLCKQAGFSTEDKIAARIGAHLMDEIKADKALLKMWERGNLNCLDKAFERYMEEFLGPMRKTTAKADSDLADRRRISRLPSLPSGGSAATSKPPERKPDDKGLTKQAHEDAWAVFQSHMRD